MHAYLYTYYRLIIIIGNYYYRLIIFIGIYYYRLIIIISETGDNV